MPDTGHIPFDGVPTFKSLSDQLNKVRQSDLLIWQHYYDNSPPFVNLDAEDPEKTKMRIAVNYPRLIVNKGANALFGKDKFKGADSIIFEEEGNFQVEFARIWDDNKMDTQTLVGARQSIRSGDVFYKVWFDPAINKHRNIRIGRINSENIEPIVTDGDMEDYEGYIIQFQTGDKTYYREEIDKQFTYVYDGIVKQVKQRMNNNTRMEIEWTLRQIIEHGLGILPIVQVRNQQEDGEVFGRSVLQGVETLFDTLNEILTNVVYAISQQADPLMWIKGAKKGDVLFKDADSIWYFENPEAALQVLQWEGTPEIVTKIWERTVDAIYEITQTPLISRNTGTLTGVAGVTLLMFLQDFKDLTGERRSNWESGFEDLVKIIGTILRAKHKDLAGLTDEEFRIKRIEWGEIIPQEALSRIDVVLKLFNARFLTRILAIEMIPEIVTDNVEELVKEIEEEDEKALALGAGPEIPEFIDEEPVEGAEGGEE